jgi:hypothetical protein
MNLQILLMREIKVLETRLRLEVVLMPKQQRLMQHQMLTQHQELLVPSEGSG